MREPTELSPTPPAADPQPRRMRPAAWAIIGAGGVIAVLVLGFFGLRLTGVLKPPVPPPACVEPILTLGTTRYRIEPLERAADGSIPAPKGAADVAHWVEGTNINYVFALNDAPGNLALKDILKAGDVAVIQWADCMTVTFRVDRLQPGLPEISALADQSTGGLTAFVQAASPEASLLIKAGRPRPPTPEAAMTEEPTGPQTDMAFGEMTTSPDGNSVSISITITNTGSAPFSVSTGDISLTPENGQPLAPVAVEPALPHEIAPGTGTPFQITFPHPGTKVALLRILDMAFDRYF